MTKSLPSIRVERLLPALPARVFAAWGSVEHIKDWFRPAGFTVPFAKVEFEVGGAFEVCMRGPDGVNHWVRGHFTDIVPPERLVIEGDLMDEAGHRFCRVKTVVLFADEIAGTRMEVEQSYEILDPLASAMIDGAPVGWEQTLDRLQDHLTRGDDIGRHVAHGQFHLQRNLHAPLARVWAAFADGRVKANWFTGPAGQFTELEREADIRPGGREVLKGAWEGGKTSHFVATYHDVIPQERLIYTYEMYMNGRMISVSLATVEMRADGDLTKLWITEHGAFLDGYDDNGSREHGTAGLLDRLEQFLRQ